MKKIIFIFICFLFTIIFVKAETISYEIIPNVYSKYTNNGTTYYSPLSYIYDEEGNNIYCVQKGVFINTFEYEVFENIDDYDEETLKQLELISYYGYGHREKTLNLYIATQELLWETLGYEVEWFTTNNGSGERIDVSNQKFLIMQRVEMHDLKPRFNVERLESKIGRIEIIHDLNGILNEYFVYDYSGNMVEKHNNALIFDLQKAGENTVYLRRDFKNLGNSKIFKANNSQTLMYFGDVLSEEVTYDYKVIGATLLIQKIDIDTGLNIASGEASLQSGRYSIYNKFEEFVASGITDENGEYFVEDLNLGKHYIREDYPSMGYLPSESQYIIEITLDNYDEIVVIPCRVLKENINIFNYYEDETIYPAVGNEFIVTNIHKEVMASLITNELGYATIALPYGEYGVIQKTVKEGYEISKEFVFIVDFPENQDTFEIINRRLFIVDEIIDVEDSELLEEEENEVFEEQENTDGAQENEVFEKQENTDEEIEILPKLHSGKYFVLYLLGIIICLKRLLLLEL